MLSPFKIPLSLLFILPVLVGIGEVATGTAPLFASLVILSLVCIGTTYNILGGLGTISGIAFAVFAFCTLALSQIAKVVLGEAADKTLEAPQLTIEVYCAFFACLMVGVFVFSRLRLKLPKPLEALTEQQASLQYAICMPVGLIANFVYQYYESSLNAEERSSNAHSIGLAFSTLLLYSIVLAVQSRIRRSHGRHSFSMAVFIPWLAVILLGLIDTSRGHMMLSTIAYGFTCYVSGFRFRKRHYAAALGAMALFVFIISPFEVFVREPMRELEFSNRISAGYGIATAIPDWSLVTQASSSGAESRSREEYYQHGGTFILSRLSGIRTDSNMISACASGFHYGVIAIKTDILHNMPHVLFKDKPDTDGAAYTGRVTGVNPDTVENGEFVISVIGDAFGAFGWLGVVIVSGFALPLALVLYDSLFDLRQPWGIVAAGGFCFQLSQVGMGGLLALTVRTPAAIFLLSYVVGMVVKMIPVKGDNQPRLNQSDFTQAMELSGAQSLGFNS